MTAKLQLTRRVIIELTCRPCGLHTEDSTDMKRHLILVHGVSELAAIKTIARASDRHSDAYIIDVEEEEKP